MPNIYTDGNASYFAPGSVNATDPTMTDCNVRNAWSYTTVPILTSSIPEEGWTIAPNLTDIGGGVWVSGLLIDPS